MCLGYISPLSAKYPPLPPCIVGILKSIFLKFGKLTFLFVMISKFYILLNTRKIYVLC